jgi:hypothetical protein
VFDFDGSHIDSHGNNGGSVGANLFSSVSGHALRGVEISAIL